jgi:helix-turn-helix protein
MNRSAMERVWSLDLAHSQQAVLLALAWHAGADGGSIFPSLGLVAWRSGYSVRQVRRIVADLRAAGLIEVVAGARDHRPTEYRLSLENGTQKPPYRPDRADNMSGRRADNLTSRRADNLTERADIAMSGAGGQYVRRRTTNEEPLSESPNGDSRAPRARLAEEILDSFNEKSGGRFTLTTRLQNAIGECIDAHPDFELGDHATVIDRCLTSQWAREQMTVGPMALFGDVSRFELHLTAPTGRELRRGGARDRAGADMRELQRIADELRVSEAISELLADGQSHPAESILEALAENGTDAYRARLNAQQLGVIEAPDGTWKLADNQTDNRRETTP